MPGTKRAGHPVHKATFEKLSHQFDQIKVVSIWDRDAMAMTLRLDSTHDEMVERLAKEMKCSQHQAVLNAIEMADQRVEANDRAINQ